MFDMHIQQYMQVINSDKVLQWFLNNEDFITEAYLNQFCHLNSKPCSWLSQNNHTIQNLTGCFKMRFLNFNDRMPQIP